MAGAQLVQGVFQGLCLFVDFGDRGLRLGDGRRGVGLRAVRGGDGRLEFRQPGPAGGKVRGGAAGVIGPFPGQGRLRAGFLGGVLPPWAARTATIWWASARSRPRAAKASSAMSLASCAAFSASATASAEAAAGAGAGCSGLPQTGTRDSGEELGGELGRGIREPLLTQVQPVLPPVLVYVPGCGVLFRDCRALGLGGEVAANDGHEFVSCRGFLGAQLDFRCQFLKGADSGGQRRRLRTQGVQGGGTGPPTCFELLQLLAQPAAAVR